jgi:Xaa-Pro aminopeptidase
MRTPARGFPRAEYEARVTRAQDLMQEAALDALLLTTEADIRYVAGFLTRFWESPTRPWYVLLPANGKPIAVIPSIGAALMAKTWLTDIRTWRAPEPADDGVSLLAETVREIVGSGGRLGVPMTLGSHLRMPLADWARLKAALPTVGFAEDAGIMRRLRMIKSDAEISKIRAACDIASRAFARVPEIARADLPLDRVFRGFQMLCLEEGADWVPYLAGGAGQSGYDDVISPADSRPLKTGDVLMLDTGLVHDGYFCDFDRNFSIGAPSESVRVAYARLIEAVKGAMEVARPGATAAELFHAMDRVLTGGQGGGDAGRLGHGLGMQLTEGLSLIPEDQTELAPGMVLTLEPGLAVEGGKIMVHEEDIVIRSGAAEYLSAPAPHEIAVLED